MKFLNASNHIFATTAFSLFSTGVAFAEINCASDEGSRFVSITCKNNSPTGASSVHFRNMPPWTANSGITIIDICEGTTQPENSSHHNCFRKYCAHDSRAMLVQFGPLVIPISPVSGYVGLLTFEAHFSISCASFANF